MGMALLLCCHGTLPVGHNARAHKRFSVDKPRSPVFHLCMPRKSPPCIVGAARSFRRYPRIFALAAALAVSLFAAGCAHLAVGKRPAAFASTATLVVDNSTSAYRAAIDLHDQEQVSAGVLAVEEGKPWDYGQLTPLISPEGLKTRVQILDALKCYAASLSSVASGVDSPALTAAAKSTASDLKTLGSDINTDAKGGKTGLALSTETANVAGTALLAIGDYLSAKKINAALPAITAQMDPQIAILSQVLTSDLDILRRQSKKDYDDLERQQWVFIQLNKAKLSPTELRDEVQKLATYRKSAETTDATLAGLQTSIGKLAIAHHELEVAAQAGNAETLSEKMAGLEAAGSKLGVFYENLDEKSDSDKGTSSKDTASKTPTAK